jgi:hypothetical protein
MGLFSTFNPIVTVFYGLIIRIKFSWFSRKKRKKRKITRNSLEKKLHNKGIEEKTVNKIIENYLKFGETIFNRKVIQAAFSINRTLDPRRFQQKNHRRNNHQSN